MNNSTIYILVKKSNEVPSIMFGFKSKGRAKLFALNMIDNELEATHLPSDVIKAYKTIFLKTKGVVIPNHFALSIEEIPFNEEP